MIFYLLFIIILILIGKHIYEIHNFNYEANIEQLQSANKEEIFEKYKERKPLLIHNLGNKNDLFFNLSFNKLIEDNPGHIIFHNNKYISLKSFQEDKIQQMNNIVTNLENISNKFKSFYGNDRIEEKFTKDFLGINIKGLPNLVSKIKGLIKNKNKKTCKMIEIIIAMFLFDINIELYGYNDLKFPNLKTKEDFVLWLKFLKKNYKIFSINTDLTSWRKLNNSLSSSTLQKLIDGFNVYHKFMKFNFIKSLYYLMVLCANYLRK